MGVWEIREIGRPRRLGDWEIGEFAENHYMRQRIRTSWNPGGFGRLGNTGDSGEWDIRGIRGIREIGKNRYMWQKWETLAGRAHGEPTNWEIGGLGVTGDWKIREIGRVGRLGDSGDLEEWEIREIREIREIWKNLPNLPISRILRGSKRS